MSDTPFVITIDTEGDDLWARPREITTRNAQYLPRFQALCERFRFKPVYLTNYEMAMSDAFVEFARDVVARGGGELLAWRSIPTLPAPRATTWRANSTKASDIAISSCVRKTGLERNRSHTAWKR